ncbi:liver-enriched gene 1, tandem duplicate 1 [Electrophorus electricus]|uniref:liver-enriched gene 1, tandem duplicate 1 n=1 Tax=Electrophorus electricus TaxID=8005 RepID=UPI0015D08AFF|nr:liver-enriched gene 1, tandem duplicate 1 [Electrophorus electricus]
MHFFRWALALASLAVLCGAAVVMENGLPILWGKTSSLLSNLSGSRETVTLDPWDYPQRMVMYRLLINASDPYMGSMGPGTNQNPLWGLPLQLAWKLRSGRLVDPTGADSCGQEGSEHVCIAASSWWGCVNYYLSVIPFLAAVEAGVVGEGLPRIEIQVPAQVAQDYCTSTKTCSSLHADAMAKWVTFFQSLKDISASDMREDEKKDQILGLMWAAELASLSTASNTCAERQVLGQVITCLTGVSPDSRLILMCPPRRQKQYSGLEGSFSESWLSSAQYLASTHFLSSVEMSELLMAPLPGRVLLDSDKPPNIADLSAEENHTLYVFSWINSVNKWLGGSLTTLWQRAMCSSSAREKGRALLQDVALNPRFALASIFSILTEMAMGC